MRLRLADEVAALINEFGPKIYDDFDEVMTYILRSSRGANLRMQFRILVSVGQVLHLRLELPGIWRRRSGTGAVDAQGNLLITSYGETEFACVVGASSHKFQTWIDERLFRLEQECKTWHQRLGWNHA